MKIITCVITPRKGQQATWILSPYYIGKIVPLVYVVGLNDK
jgi:hypothetical protein